MSMHGVDGCDRRASAVCVCECNLGIRSATDIQTSVTPLKLLNITPTGVSMRVSAG